MPARVLILACGALANEITALKRLNSWSHVDLECLPPELHNTPKRIPDAVEKHLEQARKNYARVFVAYADCGTGGRLDSVLAKHGVERLPGAHCYEFFAGAATFARLSDAEPGTFYLTDFLVRNFERLVHRGLGLDRHPQLRDAYFGNSHRLIYLSQSQNAQLLADAKGYAARLGLEFHHRHTGLKGLAIPLSLAAEGEVVWRN